MKIGKIILLVLAALLIALPVKSILELPQSTGRLENAVYLDMPQVVPENEGKIVIIHGKPELVEPVYDSELRLTLNTVKAYRYKEIYELTSSTDDEFVFKWVTRDQRSLMGKAKIGEFTLSESILTAFPTESHYSNFDVTEIANYTLSEKGLGSSDIYILPYGGTYLEKIHATETDSDSIWLRKRNTGIANEGNEAYHYRFFDAEKNGEMTVVGVQRGNELVADSTLGAIVKNGVVAKDKLISSDRLMTILGASFFILLGCVCIYFAFRNPKKPKAVAK